MIRRYQSRPRPFDAIQYTGEMTAELEKLLDTRGYMIVSDYMPNGEEMVINAHDGPRYPRPGSFIFERPEGGLDAMSEGRFHQLYEQEPPYGQIDENLIPVARKHLMELIHSVVPTKPQDMRLKQAVSHILNAIRAIDDHYGDDDNGTA